MDREKRLEKKIEEYRKVAWFKESDLEVSAGCCCRKCGRDVTLAEYNRGQSWCCNGTVVSEEECPVWYKRR